jgi:hypothetical protein
VSERKEINPLWVTWRRHFPASFGDVIDRVSTDATRKMRRTYRPFFHGVPRRRRNRSTGCFPPLVAGWGIIPFYPTSGYNDDGGCSFRLLGDVVVVVVAAVRKSPAPPSVKREAYCILLHVESLLLRQRDEVQGVVHQPMEQQQQQQQLLCDNHRGSSQPKYAAAEMVGRRPGLPALCVRVGDCHPPRRPPAGGGAPVRYEHTNKQTLVS